MSRNLYLLAASLLLFSLVSCAMSLVPNSLQPGLPAIRVQNEEPERNGQADPGETPKQRFAQSNLVCFTVENA